MGSASAPALEPLAALREYRKLAPWNLRDLAAVAAAILEASDIRPINAAANALPHERTIRFYVTRGLVAPPEGRGTAATYSYRHLLQVLTIKLKQMEGATLAAITEELETVTGDIVERRVASAIGAGLPAPERLQLSERAASPRGRAGRALHVWRRVDSSGGDTRPRSATWHRISLEPGLELHMSAEHPRARMGVPTDAIAEAVRSALEKLDDPQGAD